MFVSFAHKVGGVDRLLNCSTDFPPIMTMANVRELELELQHRHGGKVILLAWKTLWDEPLPDEED
jgi:hypothetical protein